ncbi:MAG: hypothetical protein ABIO46_15390 [Chitinophagales bacterium]
MNQVEGLFQELREYIKLHIHIAQLKFSNKSSIVASSLLTYMLLFMVIFFFVLVLTIGVSLWLGRKMGDWSLGFMLMAGVYLFIGLIIYIFRNKWVRQPLNNLIVKEIFDED